MAAQKYSDPESAKRQAELIDRLVETADLLRNRQPAGAVPLSVQDRQQIGQLAGQLQDLAGDVSTGNDQAFSASNGLMQGALMDLFWQWEGYRAVLAENLRAGAGQLLANTIAELSACQLLLGRSSAEAVQPGLAALEQELRTELAQFQALLCELNSPVDTLDELGLYACLRLYIQACARRQGVQLILSHDENPLPADQSQQLVLFRIIQLAVAQAHKLRGATRISVDLSLDEQTLILKTIDNGRPENSDSLPQTRDLMLLADLLKARRVTRVDADGAVLSTWRLTL